MPKSLFAAFLALGALALASPAAQAETTEYAFDGAHTSAEFKVRHIFTQVPGRFTQLSGTLQLDEKNLANSSVEVTIPATSVSTSNERRDNHLRTEDFFWVEKHPNITFKSTKVVPGESDAFQVLGDLTIRGVTRPVTLEVRKLGIVDAGAMMGRRAGFEASTTINRKDFGIVWNRDLDQGGVLLGDDVIIALNVEAVHKPKTEAANTN